MKHNNKFSILAVGILSVSRTYTYKYSKFHEYKCISPLQIATIPFKCCTICCPPSTTT